MANVEYQVQLIVYRTDMTTDSTEVIADIKGGKEVSVTDALNELAMLIGIIQQFGRGGGA